MDSEQQALMARYLELRHRQVFDPALLDYGRLDVHRAALTQLAQMSNCAVTVFDMYQGAHVFASYNFDELLGYDMDAIAAEGNAYFDARVHPDDFWVIVGMGVQALETFYETPRDEWGDFKVVNEYRVLGRDGHYVRILEQHQLLEKDPLGNHWLSLSMIDLSPRQGGDRPAQSTILNWRTGTSVALEALVPRQAGERATLSEREREVLGLIQRGHLSKEISDLLSISVHTVNTHRQRILQKLDVANSMEAVQLAQRLGLLD